MTRSWVQNVAGAALLLGLTMGCADYVGDDLRSGQALAREMPADPLRPDATSSTLSPTPVDSRGLEPGTCFNEPETDGRATPSEGAFARGESVLPIPCEYPHHYELFARDELGPPERSWPGTEQVAEEADRWCLTRFETFVGQPWGTNELDYLAQIPDEEGWAAGARQVSCALFELGLSPLEASVSAPE